MAKIGHKPWNKNLYRNRELRKCVICGKEFWFRLCYAKRSHRTGLCCSANCRKKFQVGPENPHAGPLVKYGSKVVQHARSLANQKRIRKEALEKIAKAYGVDLGCFNCGCDVVAALQINHTKRFASKEAGTVLARKVLRASNEEILQQYDILCGVCNWAHFISRKFGIEYEIRSRKENNKYYG